MAMMTREKAGEAVMVFRPLGAPVIPYNMAQLVCPECGMVASSIGPAVGNGETDAANIVTRRQQVRGELAAHLQAHTG